MSVTTHQQHRVQQHLQARVVDAVCHRQHRDAGARVLVAARDRQGPEVRRRPHEDDEEQQQRVRLDAAGHRGPSQHRRRRPGRAADHDVLRGRALQPHGVDDRVADQRAEGQHGGQQVDQEREQRHGRHSQHRGEDERLALGQGAARQRPRPRARHLLVDAPVEHVVDGGRAGGGERDAEIAPHQRRERRQAGAGEQRPDDRGERDERDDLRLGQLQVAAPERAGTRCIVRCGRHGARLRDGWGCAA